ncbi:hypothetical protein NA57DRAFT_80655 [Rhizodiscina lignyota]|uniref:C4-dicarboxylate transporter/malic acid transport protein n=1 Tax=Rhizodiscina lignyota TaxID=1504668 RepID=A0A9P4M4F7_9PEZI|nr:hypothetical protein NA57DRAFT_80655 [Rhizodiscina lignyota]
MVNNENGDLSNVTLGESGDFEKFEKGKDDVIANNDSDVESGTPPQRSRWSSAIETFSPNWFALCMNTGLLGIQLHQFPYKFRGSNVIATCFFISEVVLFFLFIIIQIIRFCLFPRAAWKQTIATMDELCFWGCVPIALVTIVAQIGIIGSTANSWSDSAQHGITVFAVVLWWIDTALMLVTAYVVYYLIARWRMAEKAPIPSGIFLPAVGTTTVGLVGGIMVNGSFGLSARLAVPIIFVSFLLEGFGWWIAMLVYPVFLAEIWTKGLPPPFKLPTMMMLVGPAGQVGAALHSLGTSAATYFGPYNRGTFFTAEFGFAFGAASKMLAVMFLGFDVFWGIFVIYTLAHHLISGKAKPGMPWWSTIFPLGTMNSTFLLLSQELDSPTFRVLAAGLYLLLLIDYICCWIMTIYLVWRGDLLDGRPKTEKIA